MNSANYDDISSSLNMAKESLEKRFNNSRFKIQTVPPRIRESDNYERYYKPELISIGPIHYNDPRLQQGEQYKFMWAAMFAERHQKDPQLLYSKVLDQIDDLRELFSWNDIKPRNHCNDKDFAKMLFVDGCAVLQILEKDNLSKPEELNVKVDQLVLARRDLLLLENQIPYQVLKLLADDENTLKDCMYSFCMVRNMFSTLDCRLEEIFQMQLQKIQMSSPNHLLDVLHLIIILCDGSCTKNQVPQQTKHKESQVHQGTTKEALGRSMSYIMELIHEEQFTYRTIRELNAAAIRIKKQNKVNLRDINFSSSFFGGQLFLPPLILNDSTVPTLLNLLAYEMCPDFKNSLEICSYVKLLDLLIDDPEDVRQLRETGILQNSLGSDKEVSELFNYMSSRLAHNQKLYSSVKEELEKHYKKRISIWIAEAYYTHCRSPWSIIALLAASVLLILTFIQTLKTF